MVYRYDVDVAAFETSKKARIFVNWAVLNFTIIFVFSYKL